MMRYTIFELDFSPKAEQILLDAGLEPDGFDIVICGLIPPAIGCETLLVACPMTDTRHLTIPSGVSLVSLKNAPMLRNVWATAEHTLRLVFECLRPNVFVTDTFQRPDRPGRELHDKKVFIFGVLGRIGTQLAEMLGYMCNVRGWDIKLPEECYNYKDADIIISCIDNRPENKHYFSHDFFNSLKPDAIFINTARGDVVNEAWLVEWLCRNKEATAAVDVLMKDGALWSNRKNLNNLFISPHVGGYTIESRGKTDIYIAEQIKEWINERK